MSRVLAFTLLIAALAGAQQPEPPRVYAIEGARIAPVSGPVLERGTVVLRDGLIEAVGASVAIPPDAWKIDGEGLTVYPGFIDARSALGVPAPRSASGGVVSNGPRDRPATTPWALAADLFEASDETLEKWRAGGFSSIAATPQQGIFPGRVSVLNLGRGRLDERVVRAAGALAIRIPAQNEAYSGYPGSLLGRIAYIRQIFLDAHTQRQALALYAADPVGLERPAYDRALTPLIELLDSAEPALYPANTAIEIRRALDLSREEQAPKMVVHGAQQAYAEGVAEELAAHKISALVDVSWPRAPADPDPEAEPSLRTLRFRKQAPTSPAALAQAGAEFAFFASKANGPDDTLTGVRKAVESGLSAEQALRALTLSAAEIHGVADRLGSIEPGKIANLVVFEKNPFEEKAQPKLVFIDGRRYEIR